MKVDRRTETDHQVTFDHVRRRLICPDVLAVIVVLEEARHQRSEEILVPVPHGDAAVDADVDLMVILPGRISHVALNKPASHRCVHHGGGRWMNVNNRDLQGVAASTAVDSRVIQQF